MPFALNPWLILGAFVALVGAFGGGAYVGSSYSKGQAALIEKSATKAAEAIGKVAAEEISKLEIRHVTIRQRVERETRDVPVYTDCRNSPDGLRLINQALTNRAEPAGDSKLPADSRGGAR